MALVFRNRIESDLAVGVPMEKFFGNNIAQLAELLLNQLALAKLIALEAVFVGKINEEEEREKLSL